jgi:DNA-binding LacI/PurR family transcriptional regulator
MKGTKKMKMTVRKAAEMAGVSPASVSRVLNGQGGVGDETRKKILKIISDTNYYPRKKAAHGGNIALIMPQNNLYYQHFFSFLQQILRIFGPNWNLILLPHDLSRNEFRYKCLKEKIEGVIIFGFSLSSPELENAIIQMPHVWLNSHRLDSSGTNVLIGNESAGKLAGRYLIEKDCKKCAVIDIPTQNPGTYARCEGFRFECFSQKINFENLQFDTPMLETLRQSELENIFTAAAQKGLFNKFDGIFIPESFLLPSLHLALRLTGQPLPLLVCGNNSEEHMAGISPRPAAVDLGGELLVELACQELFMLIYGKKNTPERSSFFISPKLYLP